MIGQRLLHYQIVEKLGEGGMGVVYKARDTHLDRFVAIKVLPPEKVADPARKARFIQEAKAASALNHPNIITVHDISNENGIDFIVMELVDGKTLDQLIPRKGMRLNEALKVAIQIADALARAHAAGIIHRDLKPANIMVDGHGQVKVLDFGLAKLTEQGDTAEASTATAAVKTEEGTIAGTAAYMSPEQAEGKPLDARSDIFSFGAVLYEMLCGKRAFQGDSFISTLAAVVRNEPPALAPEIPAALRDLVARCLRKNRDERFASGAGVAEALRSLDSPAAPAAPSIAVLPFTNLSPDKENEYFGDGLAEEILNALARLPGLQVLARTSSFAFRAPGLDVREIAARLGVGFLLEGSVRKAGSRIRVAVQLVKAADGYRCWSERYDRELTDVFAVQDEVSAAVASALQVRLAGGPPAAQRPTASIEAYTLFLKGRHLFYRQTSETNARAVQLFEKALQLDPGYALAHAGVAMARCNDAAYGYLEPRLALPLIAASAQRAIALDPAIAEPHACLGWAAGAQCRWSEAEPHFRRALELDPFSSVTLTLYALACLGPTGRLDEALDALRRAVAADPLSAYAQQHLGFFHTVRQELDAAAEQLARALEIDPSHPVTHVYLAMAHLARSEAAPALEWMRKAVESAGRTPFVLSTLGWAQAAAGLHAEARAALAELEAAQDAGYVPPSLPGRLCQALGDRDRAFFYYERGLRGADAAMMWIAVHPFCRELASDPRYRGLLRLANLEHLA